MVECLGLYRSGAVQSREKEAADGGAQLPLFVANKNIKSLLDKDLTRVLQTPIWYTVPGGGTKHKGFDATLLPGICGVWLKARQEGKLVGVRQPIVAQKAEMLVLGLANVGIVALVDEATGYQYDRPRRDLEEQLKRFLSDSLRRWVRTFPADYFKHLCRLRNLKQCLLWVRSHYP